MMSILTQPSLYAFFNPMTLLLSLYLCFWHTIDPDDIGDVYVGETNEDGQKHGRGKISFESGDSYEGEFVNDIICGHGTFIWGTDGATFTGEWKGKCMLSLSLSLSLLLLSHYDDNDDDEYTNLCLCNLCFLLFLFAYSSLSIYHLLPSRCCLRQ